MKKLTDAFCLRDWDWEELQERDNLARDVGCFNCVKMIIIEDIREGKEDHKLGDLYNNINMEEGQIVSGAYKGSSFIF